jgi:adhesin transport system outer membrane protein
MLIRKKLTSIAIAGLLSTSSLTVYATDLQQAVKQALETNPEVLAAISERKSRDHEIDQALGGYRPSVDLTAGIGYQHLRSPSGSATEPRPFTTTDKNRRELGLSARQLIFDGYATPSEVARQRARTNSAAYNLSGIAENTALGASEAFLNVLRRQDLVELARENVRVHEVIYRQIESRSRQGVGSQADLAQIDGRLALARANLIAEETNLKDAYANYRRVVGKAPELPFVKPDFNAKIIQADSAIARDFAVEGNPTLKSAGADVNAARAQYRAAKSPFYPRFDIEVTKDVDRDINGQAGTRNDLQVMLRMRYNLLNGGSDLARRKQTADLLTESMEIRRNTHRQVKESFDLSWNAYQATKHQLDYLQRHKEFSIRTREAYQKQFNIGQRTLLDLLNAENEVFSSSSAYTNAQYDNLFAQYRVLAVQGLFTQKIGVPMIEETKPVIEG